MGAICQELCKTRVGAGGPASPVIYVIDSPAHPSGAELLVEGLASTVVSVPVQDWNRSLTPWTAPGLYREEPDFGGQAATTLTELLDEAIPTLEATAGLAPRARAICGYSLGGLFALYAFTHASAFDACACLSGSLWYEGWVDHLRALDLRLDGKFAYFSLGTKERRGGLPILRSVQDNMEASATILREGGCDVHVQMGPGNHLQHIPERYAAGLEALDAFLNGQTHGAPHTPAQ